MPLGYVMFVASGALAVTSQQQIGFLFREATKAVGSRDTIELAGVVMLIGLLSSVMNRYGMLDQMCDSISKAMYSVKPAISVIPAFVGAMPAIGGAIISAPMVDKLGNVLEMTPSRKAAANVVFRHMLFFIYPFAPSLILSARLSGLSVNELIRAMFPFAIVFWGIGYFVFLYRAPEVSSSFDPGHRREHWQRFLVSTSPILASLLMAMVLGVPFYLALVLGIALALYLCRSHQDYDLLFLFRSINWKMGLAMVGIMVFRTMIQNAGIIGKTVSGIQQLGIPISLVFFVIPFAVGLTSASQSTTVGITFPLLLPLVPRGENLLAYVMLLYVSSFTSYFSSPLHLCTMLTNEYFKVKFVDTTRQCVPVMLGVVLTLTGLFLLYR